MHSSGWDHLCTNNFSYRVNQLATFCIATLHMLQKIVVKMSKLLNRFVVQAARFRREGWRANYRRDHSNGQIPQVQKPAAGKFCGGKM